MTTARRDVAYLDASAIVKTVIREPGSTSLRRYLGRATVHATSALSRAEVIRAIRRADAGAVPRALAALDALFLIGVTRSLLDAAGALDPAELRTLDAIHLASAQMLVPRLAAIVTYDARMAAAAAALGMPVEAPS